MEPDWQQIILLSLLGWIVLALLLSVFIGWYAGGRRDQEKEDHDQDEYLSAYSDIKFLKKQAGGRWNNVFPMKRK